MKMSSGIREAASQGRLDEVKRLVERNGIRINDRELKTALQCATINGHVQILKYLVEVGKADPSIAYIFGWTLLHFSADNGHLNVLSYLIDETKLNPEQVNQKGWTPLHFAASKGHLQVVKYLVERGNVDANRTDARGSSALHHAASNGCLEVVKYLLMRVMGDADQWNNPTSIALRQAAKGGHLELVKYLVEIIKADASIPDEHGSTVLHHAAEQGHLEVARYLVETANVDANTLNSNGQSVLHRAASNGRVAMVQYLLVMSDAEQLKNSESIALRQAAKGGHFEVLKYLVEIAKADASIPDEHGSTVLHHAAEQGHLTVVKFLVETAKVDVTKADNDGCTALHLAAWNDDLDMVKYLVETAKIDANQTDNNGQSALHRAASNGSLELIKYLMEKTSDDAEHNAASIALRLAAHGGHFEAVKYLAEIGKADTSKPDKQGSTALHLAAANGGLEVFKYLLEKGSGEVEHPSNSFSVALRLATKGGHLEMVKHLVEIVKADTDISDEHGSTVLHHAAEQRHWEIVKYLVETAKLDANKLDSNGQSALHFAASNGDLEVVKVLLENVRGNAEHWNNSVLIALRQAATGGHLEVVKYLVETVKADADTSDKYGSTALHYVAEQGHLEMAKYLVETANADVNQADNDGCTALLLATWNGHLEVVKYLLQGQLTNAMTINSTFRCAASRGHLSVVEYLAEHTNIKVNLIRDRQGQTVLHWAAKSGWLEGVRYFAALEVDANATDNYGRTPLHLAAGSGHLEIVKCLLTAHYVNPNAIDKYERTALHWAAEAGHTRVLNYLAKKGRCDCNLREYRDETAFDIARRHMRTTIDSYLDDLEARETSNMGSPNRISSLASFRGASSLSDLSSMTMIPIPPSLLAASADLSLALDFRCALMAGETLVNDLVTKRRLYYERVEEVLAPLRETNSARKIAQSLTTVRFLAREIGSIPFVNAAESEGKARLINERNEARDVYIAESKRVVEALTQVEQLDPQKIVGGAESFLRADGAIAKGLARGANHEFQSDVKILTFEQGERDLNEAFDEIKEAMFSGRTADLEFIYGKVEALMKTMTNKVILNEEQITRATLLIEQFRPHLNPIEEIAELKHLRTLIDTEELDRQEWHHSRQVRCASLHLEARQLKSKWSELTRQVKRAQTDLDHDDEANEADLSVMITALEKERLRIIDRRDWIIKETQQLALGIDSAKRGLPSARKQPDLIESLPQSMSSPAPETDGEVIHCDIPEMFHRVMIEWNSKSRNSTVRVNSVESAQEFLLKSNLSLPYSRQDDLEEASPPSFRMEGRNKIECVKLKVSGELKVLKRIYVESADDLRRLRRSLVLSRKVAHPSILACEGALVEQNSIYLQFPLLAGGDLAAWAQYRPRPFSRKQDVIARISDALVALHAMGIFHRDLKPQNVVMSSLEDDAIPQLTDFEYSKDVEHATHVTMAGGLSSRIGTLGYIAPELLSMSAVNSVDRQVLERGDVFSLGAMYVVVVLYDGDQMSIPRGGKAWFDAMLGLTGSELGRTDKYLETIQAALSEDPSKRPSSEQVRDSLCSRKCCMMIECGENKCSLVDGIACPEGKHFVCARDVDQYVNGICDSGALAAAHGEVLCPGRCGVLSLADLKGYLSSKTLEKLIEARVKVMETVLSQAMEKQKDEAVRKALAMSVLEQKVHLARNHLVEEIMTNRCPRCRQAWYDFEGCCALTCSNATCGAQFCALCNSGPFQNAHPHVRHCKWNTVRKGEYSCSENEFKRMSKERKREMIRTYFREGELVQNQELRQRVLDDRTVRNVLDEIGVVIPLTNSASC